MTRQQILDLYFLDARHKLVELAAFLDRVERADGKDDFRLKSFRAALGELTGNKKGKGKKCSARVQRPDNGAGCKSRRQRRIRRVSKIRFAPA